MAKANLRLSAIADRIAAHFASFPDIPTHEAVRDVIDHDTPELSYFALNMTTDLVVARLERLHAEAHEASERGRSYAGTKAPPPLPMPTRRND